MFAANDGRSGTLRHALAGLHAGVLGSLAMLACLMVGSLWDHRSIWLVPNLLATTFFGSEAYRDQLVRTSWAGLALLPAVYGALGLVWGLIWRDSRKPGLALYGIITGLAVYFLFYDFLWKQINPVVTLYAPDRQLQIGHALWGLALARSPGYSRNIAKSMADPVASGSEPVIYQADGESVHEVSSGEVTR